MSNHMKVCPWVILSIICATPRNVVIFSILSCSVGLRHDICFIIYHDYHLQRLQMLKNRFLILIPAFFLVVILFASMPLNFAHKIGSGCLSSQSKQVLQCNPCMYHSVTSQSETGNLAMAGMASTPLVFQSSPRLSGETADLAITTVSNPFSEALPLRC